MFSRNQLPLRQRGTFAHVSSRVLTLPVIGVDAQIDKLILDGKIRDVTLMTAPDGKQFRVGREKGTTYRHKTVALWPDAPRKVRREMYDGDWRAA